MYIFGYLFEGPYSLTTSFNDVPGVYLIMDAMRCVVDVGQTDKLGKRITSHDREPCWTRNSANQLWFANETSEQNRLTLESAMRKQYNPKCGIR